MTLWQSQQTTLANPVTLGAWNAKHQGLGGWTLDVHHFYDPGGRVIYFGNGTRRSAANIALTIETIAGIGKNGTGSGYSGDGGPATEATLCLPEGIAVGPDGSVYIADTYNHAIRRVDPDGIITTVAGTGQEAYSGDGGPAKEAMLAWPEGVAVGQDGSIYIADNQNCRIRRIGPDGIITTIAGTGEYEYNGDGLPATETNMLPVGIAIGPDGSLFFTDDGRIRRIGPDGIVTTVAGPGRYGYGGDGG